MCAPGLANKVAGAIKAQNGSDGLGLAGVDLDNLKNKPRAMALGTSIALPQTSGAIRDITRQGQGITV